MSRKFLVTSAIQETWGDKRDVFFLGEWCKLYSEKNKWSILNSKTQSHHWKDRVKYKKDHDYIHIFYEDLLNRLSSLMNDFYDVNHSVKYWRIILGPWLISYLGISFDRWETLRIFFENNSGIVDTCWILNEGIETTSWDDLVLRAADDDHWNYSLFIQIIQYQYLEKVNFIKVDKRTSNDDLQYINIKNIIRDIYLKFKDYAGVIKLYTSLRINKYVFHTSQFSKESFTEINKALNQVSINCDSAFSGPVFKKNNSKHRPILVDQLECVENSFENYILQNVVRDMPEIYFNISNKISWLIPSFKDRRISLFSSHSYVNNENFRVLAAEMVESGHNLNIIFHGGSLQSAFDFFEHEYDIANNVITWYRPLDDKSTQLTPAKLAGNKLVKKSGVFCTIIGCELARYPYRISAMQPPVETNLEHFMFTNTMIDSLCRNAYKKLIIRPYFNMGWDTRQRFIDIHGVNKVTRIDETYTQTLENSKLIICTYPVTTFAEAMSSNIPTILCYPFELFDLSYETKNIVAILIDANILFGCPITAADHINAIWPNISDWWNSQTVVDARVAFATEACNVKEDWVKEWCDFITSE